ncbi:hypothetical protein [Streptosporangium sp. H16]|uniref:hypothetical protein n=1 Tax=Streptosporangium sp. H16 TaxID=3444184 RepID=UPI003F7A57CA
MVVAFGANVEGAPILAAMQKLPEVLAYRSRLAAPLIPAKVIEPAVVNGPFPPVPEGESYLIVRLVGFET